MLWGTLANPRERKCPFCSPGVQIIRWIIKYRLWQNWFPLHLEMNEFKTLAVFSCLGFELPNTRFSTQGSFHCERQSKYWNVLASRASRAEKSSNHTTTELLRKNATAKSCSEKEPLLMRRSCAEGGSLNLPWDHRDHDGDCLATP